MTDRNEALRLAEWLRQNSSGIYRPAADAAYLLDKQAERIAELEGERDTLRADLHIARDDAAQMLASTQALRAERDQLRAEVERLRVDAKEEEARLIRVCGLLGASNAERDQLLAKVETLTKPFGESHLVSLIDAAIQGHASTREAMRWFAAQITPKAARTKQDPDQNTIKNVDGVVMVCPKKDSMCGDRPDNWCETCPNQNRIKKPSAGDQAGLIQ